METSTIKKVFSESLKPLSKRYPGAMDSFFHPHAGVFFV
jgi:hypothetical protein